MNFSFFLPNDSNKWVSETLVNYCSCKQYCCERVFVQTHDASADWKYTDQWRSLGPRLNWLQTRLSLRPDWVSDQTGSAGHSSTLLVLEWTSVHLVLGRDHTLIKWTAVITCVTARTIHTSSNLKLDRELDDLLCWT